MNVQIKVPQAGESVTSGLLATWLVDDGAEVAEGQELFEFETDKATIAVPSPASGVIKRTVKAGIQVEVGTVVGEIVDAVAAGDARKAASTMKAASGNGSRKEDQALSPAVRRVVEEARLDASAIAGTGKGGRITKLDALQASEAALQKTDSTSQAVPPKQAASASAALPIHRAPSRPGERQTRVPMTTIRKLIAERLVAAKHEAAHLTTFNEIDMTAVMGLRSEYRESFEAKHGVRLGVMSFFVKAACEALSEFPSINAQMDGDDIVYNNFFDIGVAVASERGLVVPVLRDADLMSFAQVELAIAELARKAREKKLTVDELTGGTFTITNGGVFGSLLSTPIPNYPQSAILGMHAIQKRAVVVDDAIVVRPMMYVALTYDHRIVDGQGAVGFLVRIKQLVESPTRLLLAV